MGQRKSLDQMTMSIDKEGNMVNIETLLRLFENQRDMIIISRPLLGTKEEIEEAAACDKKYHGTYPTEQGIALGRYLLSLPFVERVAFMPSGRIVIRIYDPFSLKDEAIAGHIKESIKKCAEKTAGKLLTVVDNLLTKEHYKEVPA